MKIKGALEFIIPGIGILFCLWKILTPTINKYGLWQGLWHVIYPDILVYAFVSVLMCSPIYFYLKRQEKREQEAKDRK